MGTTLQHGVYLPNEGERNCYAGLKTNWEILDQKVADVTALQQAVAGALHREIVASLPTTDIDSNTIYMILSGTSATENVYNEFMYVNNAWELIGTSATDLTNYYTKGDVDGLLLLKANASDLTSHTGDTTIHVTANDKSKWNTVALIKQLRLVNTQVGSSTTIAFANIDDTNGIKVGDKCMDLDAKMFEITAVDTTNQTVTVGSALIDLALDANVVHTNEINSSGIGIIEAVKEVGGVNFNTLTTQGLYGTNASGSTNNPENSPCVVQVIKRLNSVIQIANVSSSSYKSRYIRYCADITAQAPVWQSWVKFATDDNVMHLSGNETADGLKTFLKYITSDGSSTGDEYSSNTRTNLWLMGNRDTEEVSGILFDSYRQNTAQGTGIHILGIGIKENNVRYEGCRWGWYWDNNLNGYSFEFKPTTQGTNQAVKHSLGTSTDKWDTINGINPGALSLPDLSNGIDISGYITNFGAGTVNEYTPVADGWISIANSGDSPVFIRVYNDYGFEQVVYSERNEVGGTTGGTYTRFGSLMIPCVKNVKIYIIVSPTSSVLVSAKFYPCRGNV